MIALPSSQGTPFGPLLLAVFTSIFEVFLLCLAGYILAARGVLDKKTQKKLNRLNVSLFTPALLFSKVAFFLTPERLRELWVIPVFFLVITAVSGIVASVLGWLFKLKHSQRNFAMAAAMFMNSNSLPIALMQSLVVTVPDLRWDFNDNRDAMVGRALTYLVMHSTLGMILRWSYGVHLLSQADPEVAESESDESTPLLGDPACDSGYSRSTPFTWESSLEEDAKSSRIISQLEVPRRRPSPLRQNIQFPRSYPDSPNRSRADLDQYGTGTSDDCVVDMELPSFNQLSDSNLTGTIRRCFVRYWTAFNDFMTAPLWAASASLMVATIPVLQHWLQFHGTAVSNAISSAGNCSIPITLVVLGAYFYPQPPEAQTTYLASDVPNMTTSDSSASASSLPLLRALQCFFTREAQSNQSTALTRYHYRKGETKTVIIAILSRMVLTPVVLIPLLAFHAKYGFTAVFEDPIFVVVNVLLIASPPALTLAQITQRASGDAFERLISRTIFWSYCIVTPFTTIITVLIGLLLAKL